MMAIFGIINTTGSLRQNILRIVCLYWLSLPYKPWRPCWNRLVFQMPYLWNEAGDTQFLFHFWNKYIITCPQEKISLKKYIEYNIFVQTSLNKIPKLSCQILEVRLATITRYVFIHTHEHHFLHLVNYLLVGKNNVEEAILGDSGAVSGGGKKSEGARKNLGEEKSRTFLIFRMKRSMDH